MQCFLYLLRWLYDFHLFIGLTYNHFQMLNQLCFPRINTMWSLNKYYLSWKKIIIIAILVVVKWYFIVVFFLFVFRFYLFIFREKGREGEREGEKHQCVVASHVAPTGNLAYNPGMCPDWNQTGNPLVHRPTQSTGPHQPGLIMVLIFITLMTNNAEHLFMHLLVIYIFSLEKFLFKSFACF